MSKWINVDERLPGDTGKYLVVLRTGSMAVEYGVSIIRGKMAHGNFRFMEGDWQKVTHWMPLPELPQ